MSAPSLSTRRWSELSRGSQVGVVVLGAAQIALQGVALVDLARRPADQVRGPKAAWAAASFVNFIGPLVYLTIGRAGQGR